jgi:hypothetical protein
VDEDGLPIDTSAAPDASISDAPYPKPSQSDDPDLISVDEDGLPIEKSAFPSQSEANEPPEPISENRNVVVGGKHRAEVVGAAIVVDDVGKDASSTMAEIQSEGVETAVADDVTGASSTLDVAAGGEKAQGADAANDAEVAILPPAAAGLGVQSGIWASTGNGGSGSGASNSEPHQD